MATSEVNSSNVLLGNIRTSEIEDKIAKWGYVFLFRERNGEKYIGFEPDVVASFRSLKRAAYVLVEADGAQRLPLKGYAEYEPPLPAYVDWHIIVVGVDALLQPINEKTSARFEILREFLGLGKDAMLTPPLLLSLLTSPEMYLKNSPVGAQRILCLNKSDLMEPVVLEKWVTYLRPRLQEYAGIEVTGQRKGFL
jgi:probable selenium-dependent hydroxylase accessory protein YqeC